MKWKFTPDRFTHAWSEAGLDRIPYPFSVRPSARTESERATQTTALADWYVDVESPDLDVALHLISESAIRVEVWGARSTYPVRVLGCGTGDTAVVVSQRPGDAEDVGGDLTVTLGAADTVGRRIVSALPTVAAGGASECRAPVREVARSSATVVMASPAARSVAGEVRKLLNARRSGIGHLVVTAGRNLPSTPTVLSWIDIADDGRYLVRTDVEVRVVPITSADFATELQRALDETGEGAVQELSPGPRPHHDR